MLASKSKKFNIVLFSQLLFLLTKIIKKKIKGFVTLYLLELQDAVLQKGRLFYRQENPRPLPNG